MFIGARVEIAPHLDDWMRGDRYGQIVGQTADGRWLVEYSTSGRRRPLTESEMKVTQ